MMTTKKDNEIISIEEYLNKRQKIRESEAGKTKGRAEYFNEKSSGLLLAELYI